MILDSSLVELNRKGEERESVTCSNAPQAGIGLGQLLRTLYKRCPVPLKFILLILRYCAEDIFMLFRKSRFTTEYSVLQLLTLTVKCICGAIDCDPH